MHHVELATLCPRHQGEIEKNTGGHTMSCIRKKTHVFVINGDIYLGYTVWVCAYCPKQIFETLYLDKYDDNFPQCFFCCKIIQCTEITIPVFRAC